MKNSVDQKRLQMLVSQLTEEKKQHFDNVQNRKYFLDFQNKMEHFGKCWSNHSQHSISYKQSNVEVVALFSVHFAASGPIRLALID